MARPLKYNYTEADAMLAEGRSAYEVSTIVGIPLATLGAHVRAMEDKERKARVYYLEGQEIHKIGQYVGVAWNTAFGTKDRKGNPYIVFCTIEESAPNTFMQAEDSPVDGGFSPENAKQIVSELRRAIRYVKKSRDGLKENGNGNQDR